jgi:hypothetical protein
MKSGLKFSAYLVDVNLLLVHGALELAKDWFEMLDLALNVLDGLRGASDIFYGTRQECYALDYAKD